MSDTNGSIDVKVDERILPIGTKDAAMVKIGRRKVPQVSSSFGGLEDLGGKGRESKYVSFQIYKEWSKLDLVRSLILSLKSVRVKVQNKRLNQKSTGHKNLDFNESCWSLLCDEASKQAKKI